MENNQDKKIKNEEERHATWLELFYDIVFIVTVSQLSHYLFHDISFIKFFSVFISLYTYLVVVDKYNIFCY
jgi:low temperature requirement protein LtrA